MPIPVKQLKVTGVHISWMKIETIMSEVGNTAIVKEFCQQRGLESTTSFTIAKTAEISSQASLILPCFTGALHILTVQQ